MCRKETVQSYLVLKAFEDSSERLSMSQIKLRVDEGVKQLGVDDFSKVGPRSFSDVMDELFWGNMVVSDEEERQLLTAKGCDLKSVLGGYVQTKYPSLVAS